MPPAGTSGNPTTLPFMGEDSELALLAQFREELGRRKSPPQAKADLSRLYDLDFWETGPKGKRICTEPQSRFWRSPARFRCLLGGIGAGKTRGGVIDCLRQPAGSRGMVVAPTYRMLQDATLQTFMERTQELGCLREWNKSDMVATLWDNKQVLFRSGDEPDRLRGPNLGWFYMDEMPLCEEQVFLILMGRLREAPGRGWGTGTPQGFNYVYKLFWDNPSPDYEAIVAPTRTNPFLPELYIESLESRYTDAWRRQELDAEFVSVSSLARFNAPFLWELLKAVREAKEENTLRLEERPWACPLTVYEDPRYTDGRPGRYLITADVAEGLDDEGDHDYSVAHVYALDTWKQVAHYRGRVDTHTFAIDLATLGLLYHGALIAVERNNHGHAVLDTLMNTSRYPNLYYDDTKKAGFASTSRSKAQSEDDLESIIDDMAREGLGQGFDWPHPGTLEELLHYVKKPGGKTGADTGCHDDEVTCCKIAAVLVPEYTTRRRIPRSPKTFQPIVSQTSYLHPGIARQGRIERGRGTAYKGSAQGLGLSRW